MPAPGGGAEQHGDGRAAWWACALAFIHAQKARQMRFHPAVSGPANTAGPGFGSVSMRGLVRVGVWCRRGGVVATRLSRVGVAVARVVVVIDASALATM